MIFSDLDTAIELAPEIVAKEEHDLYLCESNYPSGSEYSLRKEVPSGFSYINCFRIQFNHHFKTEKSARAAAGEFEKRTGKKVKVRPEYEVKKGYQMLSHFYLKK